MTTEDRIALVTGASRGLGKAAALALAKTGTHIIATARTIGALEELDDEIKAAGGSATLVQMDLGDPIFCCHFAPPLKRFCGLC